MQVEVLENADAAAQRAASLIAADATAAIAARGRFVVAFSGGHTPWMMLRHLAGRPLPWGAVHVLQVDERIAPDGDADRNWTHMRESLVANLSGEGERPNLHAMPVTATDLDAAALDYAKLIQSICGTPPTIDLVHLGLGPDGHTASLVPNDSVLAVTSADVALTGGTYQGRRRMTLTYPTLDRARRILWLATGPEKVEMLRRLRARDESIPAGRVSQERAVAVVDRAAAG